MLIDPQVLAQGGTTMIVGMGIVFSFLVLMVCAMFIMSNTVAWLNKVCPVIVPETKTTKKSIKKTDDSEIAIAIAAAMAQ